MGEAVSGHPFGRALVASLIGFVAMFRNVTPAVSMVPDVNDLALPLWLVIPGIAFVRERSSA